LDDKASRSAESPMTIRPINEADIPAVVEMMLLNWDGVMSQHHSPAVVRRFRSEVTPEWLRRQMKWKQIFVLPDLHGRGIGTLLMKHLRETARRSGVTCLHVPSSRNAVSFYQCVGFAVDAAQPDSADEITWMTMSLQDE